MKNLDTRNYSADFIRFLAIFCVVIIHVVSEFLSSSNAAGINYWVVVVIQSVAKIAVPLFILLSGLLILDSSKQYSLSEFYKKRVAKVGIPILFWPFFYYLGFLVVAHKSISLVTLVNDYISLNMFYHLYFLYIILGLYLIAPFLKKVLAQSSARERKFLVMGTLSLSAMSTFLVYFLVNPINYWSIFTVFIPFIGYFLAGVVLKNIKLNKKEFLRYGMVFMTVTLITSLAKVWAHGQVNQDFMRYFNDVLSLNVIAMSLMGYVMLLNLQHFTNFFTKQMNQKYLKQISAVSFGIYIIHPLLLFLIDRLLPSLNVVSSAVVVPFLVLKVGIIFAASYLVVALSNKVKYLQTLMGN